VAVRVRALADPDVPDYDTPYDQLGIVTQCTIPLAHTPALIGTINFAVTSVDDTGVESLLTTGSLTF
jgi:hypothetical protein